MESTEETCFPHLRAKVVQRYCSVARCGKLARHTCGRCHAVRYCSREHQEAHFPEHKTACKKVGKAREKMDREAEALRNAPDFLASDCLYTRLPQLSTHGLFRGPGDPFVHSVGHFWGLWDTRDYMRARTTVIDYMRSINSGLSIAVALNMVLGSLRLCRSDNQGLREWAPALFLRLGMDQAAYDFIKWWATCDPDGHYDWGDTSLPYLSIQGADVTEPLRWKAPFSLDMLLGLLLIKYRSYQRMRAVEACHTLLMGALRGTTGPLPSLAGKPEVLNKIRHFAVRPLASEVGLFYDLGPLAAFATTQRQVVAAAGLVKKHNQHLLRALASEKETRAMLQMEAGPYSTGSVQEASLTVKNMWMLWSRMSKREREDLLAMAGGARS